MGKVNKPQTEIQSKQLYLIKENMYLLNSTTIQYISKAFSTIVVYRLLVQAQRPYKCPNLGLTVSLLTFIDVCKIKSSKLR